MGSKLIQMLHKCTEECIGFVAFIYYKYYVYAHEDC